MDSIDTLFTKAQNEHQEALNNFCSLLDYYLTKSFEQIEIKINKHLTKRVIV